MKGFTGVLVENIGVNWLQHLWKDLTVFDESHFSSNYFWEVNLLKAPYQSTFYVTNLLLLKLQWYSHLQLKQLLILFNYKKSNYISVNLRNFVIYLNVQCILQVAFLFQSKVWTVKTSSKGYNLPKNTNKIDLKCSNSSYHFTLTFLFAYGIYTNKNNFVVCHLHNIIIISHMMNYKAQNFTWLTINLTRSFWLKDFLNIKMVTHLNSFRNLVLHETFKCILNGFSADIVTPKKA